MLLTVFAALQIGRSLLAAMGRGCLACVLTRGRWFSESALMICFSQCETVFCTLQFPGKVSQCRYSFFSPLPFPAIASFCGYRVFQFIGISTKKKKWIIWESGGQSVPFVCVCMHEHVCVCMWGRDSKSEIFSFSAADLCIYYSAIYGLIYNKNIRCIFSEIITFPFWKHANDLNCVLLDNENDNCKKLVKYIHGIEKVWCFISYNALAFILLQTDQDLDSGNVDLEKWTILVQICPPF